MAAKLALSLTDDRQALEQLCRYITRPALANERVQTNAAGQVVLKLKTPWRDGTTHLVMSPLEFMQRLAALVPRPRLHLIRFHGVLAPNAKLRALVVPQEPEPPAQGAQPAECEANCAHHRPVRLSWAKLLKRVFEIDLEHCPNCGGELKIIAAILEQPVIQPMPIRLAPKLKTHKQDGRTVPGCARWHCCRWERVNALTRQQAACPVLRSLPRRIYVSGANRIGMVQPTLTFKIFSARAKANARADTLTQSRRRMQRTEP